MSFWDRSKNKISIEASIKQEDITLVPNRSNDRGNDLKNSQDQHFLGAIKDGGVWLS
tara:strand:+ start:257 stop:427 length:171 start_codon:yes stop_codon:yes gene_type:complete